jgi:streptomycin 6-kinase
MKTLTNNITNIFGEKGKLWIASLPNVVEVLAVHWQLRDVIPVDNMTFNYVAKAISITHQPVILKISCDAESIADERQALVYFDGEGSIKLIDCNEKYNALLLQQAVTGETLKSLYSSQAEYVMDSYIGVMKKLHDKNLPNKHRYRHITDWLKALDKLTPEQVPAHIIDRAIELRDRLLVSMGLLIFLHGDLHHDNILKSGDQWLAIDPKGVVGEAEFEIAAFDFMYVNELANKSDAKTTFVARVNLLAQQANLNTQRIKDWVFVRLVLMAAWQVEDNGDPRRPIKLAEIFM